MSRKRDDLIGQRFGRLIIISYNEEVSRQKGRSWWNCKCDCGNEKVICGSKLKSGHTTSCGCFMKEKSSENAKKLWENEDFRNEHSKRQSEIAKKQWEDEDFRRMRTEEARVAMINRWENDKEYREMMSKQMKLKRAEWEKDSDYKRKQSEHSKKLWENEEFAHAMSNKARKQWEDEDFRKMKIEQGKRQYHPKGELHPNYNHNMTDEERNEGRLQEGYKEWTQKVKENANYTCECCGQRGGKLHSHHKDGYKWCKERRIDITNGVCLCEKCHREFHSKYGVKNNTEQQYIDFKNNKLQKL